MKYLVYAALAFIAGLLFLPATGTTEIRNWPLLLFILSVILFFIFVRFFKYVILILKTPMFNRKILLTFFLNLSRISGKTTLTAVIFPMQSLRHPKITAPNFF